MNYFYADREDKNGNRLITSYPKKTQAKKFGGDSARISNENFYIGDDGRATKEKTGLILRSKLNAKATDTSSSSGKYVLYRETEGKYVPTEHRYAQYGEANNVMKALSAILGTLLVVEEVGVSEPKVEEEDSIEVEAASSDIF